MMNLRAVLSFLLLSLCCAAAPAAEIETLARFPSGTFLENGEVDGDGALYFTSYFDKRIYVWRAGAPPKVFAQLPVHPVGLLIGPRGFTVSAHGAPFTAGPAFTATQQLLELDRKGNVTRQLSVVDARFLNGLVRAAGGILIADSIAATIWKYDPAAGTVEPWLQNEVLSQDPAVTAQKPGANGLKLRDRKLYVSNSSRGTLTTIDISGVRPAGVPKRVATFEGIDDFAFDQDGSVIVASHGESLYRLAPDGIVTTVMAPGCGGCTAVVPARTRRTFYVLTTGAMFAGSTEEAKVLTVRLL